jgi:hypothetical protein
VLTKRLSLSLAFVALAALSCATASTEYRWQGQFFSFLPEVLPGAPVMLLPTIVLVADSGAVGASETGFAAKVRLDSAIATTFANLVTDTPWLGANEVRSRAEANPSLPHPDSMPMHLLPLKAAETVPRPLMTQIGALAKIHPGRYILVPGRVTYKATRTGRARVEASLVMIDVKIGWVLWRSDFAGEADTELNAIAVALRRLTAIHGPIPKGK